MVASCSHCDNSPVYGIKSPQLRGSLITRCCVNGGYFSFLIQSERQLVHVYFLGGRLRAGKRHRFITIRRCNSSSIHRLKCTDGICTKIRTTPGGPVQTVQSSVRPAQLSSDADKRARRRVQLWAVPQPFDGVDFVEGALEHLPGRNSIFEDTYVWYYVKAAPR